MISLFFLILGVLIVFGVIELIKYIDGEHNLKCSEKGKRKLVFIILFSTTLIYLKEYGRIEFIFYYYLSLYLIITGYIDFKIKKVYCILNYITIVVALVFMIYQIRTGTDISLILGSFIIYVILTNIFRIIKCYSGGDNEIYIAIGYFVASANNNSLPLYSLMMNMLGSSLVLILLNLNRFKSKANDAIKEKIEFGPSIAISTILTILII